MDNNYENELEDILENVECMVYTKFGVLTNKERELIEDIKTELNKILAINEVIKYDNNIKE